MRNRLSKRLNSFDSAVFRNLFIHQQILLDPIDLSVGSPEDKTHEKIKQAGIRAIENNLTGYTPGNGISELRHAVTNKLYKENGIMLPANQVTIVPGLTTGLLLTYMAVLDPKDEVITMDPGYPPYAHLAKALGAKVVSIPTKSNFQLDLKKIRSSITDKTKLILINTPNNPTGAVYPEKDLRELVKIASERDILVISDEIYEHFVYDTKHFSIASIYPNTISMHGFSKQYSMTGWRLGYISGPYDVIEAINEIQQYAVFSSSAIAQWAALEALSLQSDLKGKYKKKRDYVVKELQKAGIEVNGAQGSYYAFFKVPAVMDDIEFSERLLDHNLIMVPGRAFSSSHSYIRLSYGVPMDTLQKGMTELQKLLTIIQKENS